MSKVRYLYDNNGTFRFRRAVPADVQTAIGKAKYDVHLKGVKDRAVAEKEARKLTVLTDELFDEKRRELADAPRIQQKVQELMQSLPERFLAQVMGHASLPRAAAKRMSVAKTRKDAEQLKAYFTEWQSELPRAAIESNAAYLKRTGRIPVLKNGVSHQQAVERYLQKNIAGLSVLLDGVGAIPLPKAFEEIITLWKRENDPEPHTIEECRRSIRYLEEALGDPVPLTALTREHMLKFRTWLFDYRTKKGKAFAPWSRTKHFGFIKRLLKVARDNGLIDHNPAAEITMPKIGRDDAAATRRATFSNEQLRTIAEACLKLTKSGKEADKARGWVTLLALTTGARLGEVANVHPGQIVMRDGVHCLHVRGRVKTGDSIRYLPLPQFVLDSGFQTYMTDARKAREMLFNYGGVDSVSKAISKWFGRFLANLGIETADGEVFHSFRHTMKDKLRSVGADKELRDRVMGHAAGDVAATYGDGHGLLQMKEALDSAVALMLTKAPARHRTNSASEKAA